MTKSLPRSRSRLAAALLCAALVLRCAASASASESEASWETLFARARASIELGDGARARALLDELSAIRPGSVETSYLLARLLEREGRWAEALEIHGRLLTEDQDALSDEWIELLAARWARAHWERDEVRLRDAASRAVDPVAGRCIVFPLEPLILDESSRRDREDLAALGAAAAAWVIAALSVESGGEALSLHSALRLLGRVEPGSRAGASRAGEEDLPPVTTMQGVARRLAAIAPAGPPSWAPDEAAPARYLVPGGTEATAEQVASALAHFQGEHDLAPTGISDPGTQAALERAWRDSRAHAVPATPFATGADPLRAAAARLGAESLLTGTLEPLPGGEIRWNAAWVRASDGALLSPPLAGTIVPAHFQEAWDLLVRRIVSAWLTVRGDDASIALGTPAAPTEEGARAYGRAMLFLEAGRNEEAAILLGRSSRAGGGPLADWSALAWGMSASAAERIEKKLLDEAMLGPLGVSPALLRQQGSLLSRGLIGPPPAGVPTGDWLSGQTLRSLPFEGWIVVTGSLESR